MNERLGQLLTAVGNRELTDEQQRELESLVRGNVQACRQYIRHVHLHASLPRIFGYSPTNTLSTELPSHAKAPEPQIRSHRLPLNISRTGIAGFSWVNSSLAACFVALVFYGGFVLLAWNLRPDRSSLGDHGREHELARTSAQGIATVTGSSGAQGSGAISDQKMREHASFRAGELVELAAGEIQLTFADGAHVTLVGPCKFVPENSHRGQLQLGKLVAHVPAKAIGFTIATPTAEIVDLGTEFGVETDGQGTTEVQVFKGKVAFRPDAGGDDSSAAARSVTLEAGAARRVERSATGNGLVMREATFTPERFPTQSSVSKSNQVRQIVVEGAYASSAHQSLPVDNLIRDRGLKGDRHSADWHGTMWHSDYGDIKNVVVAFDLARSHRLNSMKVWNFNDEPSDGRFAWVGVKQADIYISISGKGDPLSQPANWKLVAADQQFSPGTGKNDYATPTVVSLGDVEGRFVAIVIDDALGRDPNPSAPQIVGLSEVQFFGSRVELPK